MTTASRSAPPRDCGLCPRLRDFVLAQRLAHPDWHNAPVPSFGEPDAGLLVVGLAPGLRGANRTGRPFTGDFAGELLYTTLAEFGLSTGRFAADPDDGLRLVGTRITNAVRCVPPANRPLPAEIATCRVFLAAELRAAPAPKVILALGRIAHESVLRTLGVRPASFAFAHGAEHRPAGGLTLVSSYHCSRYNTQTGRLTTEMFRAVVGRCATLLAQTVQLSDQIA